MKITLLAIGQAQKQAAEHILAEKYRVQAAKRGKSIGISDFQFLILRGRQAEHDTLTQILQKDPGGVVVVLDERGKNLSSRQFADFLKNTLDEGVPHLRFVIGGADGLPPPSRQQADLVLALGRATWPHLLARAMLAEQIWRAVTILTNHPYHRE